MLLVTLEASLLGNMLTGKGMLRVVYGNKEGKEMLRVGYGNKDVKGMLRPGYGSSIKKNLIPLYFSTNFEIQKYYQNEPRFNGDCSRDNLPKRIKDGAYVINLDKYADVGTYWIPLYVEDI